MPGDLAGPFSGLAVIFDLDGTLIDTAADLAAAMNAALAAAGRPSVPPGEVRHLVGHGARAMLHEGFSRTGVSPTQAEMDAHVAAFLAHYIDHIADQSRPFPGAVEAVDRLIAAGARVAICTNKREEPARLLIGKLGLLDRFAAIVGMDTIGIAKPDPAPVRHCLELTGCRRGVFVGDSDTDIRAAAAAGLPMVAVRFGYGPLTLEAEAVGALDAYAPLPDLIAAIVASAPIGDQPAA